MAKAAAAMEDGDDSIQLVLLGFLVHFFFIFNTWPNRDVLIFDTFKNRPFGRKLVFNNGSNQQSVSQQE